MIADSLIGLAFPDESADLRRDLLEDIQRDDASWSVFGWHEFLPPAIRRAWQDLDMGQRLVAYIGASHRSSYANAYDGQ